MKDNNFLNAQANNMISHFLNHSACATHEEVLSALQLLGDRVEERQQAFASDWNAEQAPAAKTIN
ncbi:hypothetical protein [Pseudoalteromonas umbrosa]|uniref:hypothetical protein n=1 Tax=Pseudoalteromonas umbrosa TaxID=3048489 RepID=UPI0024C25EF2|nr:hypothetical protein [Pseudoalteromonas sp. B95]MDK1288530.1 hypothetical protein [Pseudoalteromonas sp. B95]